MQRAAAQPLAADTLQDGAAEPAGTYGRAVELAELRSDAGHPQLAQSKAGSLPILAQPWLNGVKLTAPLQGRAASSGAVALCKAQGGDVSKMSPYDIRMLAHLKRLDQKAAAMKVPVLAHHFT